MKKRRDILEPGDMFMPRDRAGDYGRWAWAVVIETDPVRGAAILLRDHGGNILRIDYGSGMMWTSYWKQHWIMFR